MMPRTICLHGPESTGKSTLGPLLAAHLGGVLLDEYGRDFAEAEGTDFTMPDLVTIARAHDAKARGLLAAGADPLIVDTDPLMTAVWADMLFGTRDPWFDAWTGTADLYLLFDIDLPWVEDGTRMFGTPTLRQKFFDLAKAELHRRGLSWALVNGQSEARFASALAAIEAAAAQATAAR
ncbi:ATP-binding protein [Sphingomonas sp. M1-B02]|uniref:ATP-binding protein n=1 Tax=Sphingomonas sp. M1-B02 TaxID=3114300 RepID=UPI00223FBC42|nr:ATP-binding protein [Sphingomonas sp. S6-11]UZK67457.1 ATP-binding protein [Sphingomonas sp. S6-11]